MGVWNGVTVGLVFLAAEGVALLIFCVFIAHSLRRRRQMRPVVQLIVLLGFVYFLRAILDFAFGTKLVAPVANEILLVHSFLVGMTAIIFTILISEMTGYRDLILLLVIYVLGALSLWLLFSNDVLLGHTLSYLFLAVQFLHLALFPQPNLRRAGLFGLAFACSAALLALGGVGDYGFLAVLMRLPLFGLLYHLYKGIKRGHAIVVSEKVMRFSFIRFARFVGFTAVFYLFTALAVVGLHEFGHAVTARYYGCEYSKAVIYDIADMPHTEYYCTGEYNDTFITLGGIIATTVIGFFLLLLGGRLIDSMSFFVLGFGYLISSSDIREITPGGGIRLLFILVALTFLVLSVVELVQSFRGRIRAIEEHFYLQWDIKTKSEGDGNGKKNTKKA